MADRQALADQPPAAAAGEPGLGRVPGPGEITVAVPLGRPLCTTLDHRHAHRRAAVVALFGPPPAGRPPPVFPGCWGRSYPLCDQCWHDTRALAQRHHPAVVIHDTRGHSSPTTHFSPTTRAPAARSFPATGTRS